MLHIIDNRFSCGLSTNSFVFEFDSQSVLTWAYEPSSVPWHFLNILWEYHQVFGSCIGWFIRHIGCSRNGAAFALGRLGSSGMNFLEFG